MVFCTITSCTRQAGISWGCRSSLPSSADDILSADCPAIPVRTARSTSSSTDQLCINLMSTPISSKMTCYFTPQYSSGRGPGATNCQLVHWASVRDFVRGTALSMKIVGVKITPQKPQMNSLLTHFLTPETESVWGWGTKYSGTNKWQ